MVKSGLRSTRSRSFALAVAALALGAALPPFIAAQAAPSGGGSQLATADPARMSAPTLRAYRLAEEVRLDGLLDEPAWDPGRSSRGFIQTEPVEGSPAANDTEVWVAYDDEALYVAAMLHDGAPESIARSLSRRDAVYSGQFDFLEVMLDTNLDRRTGYAFRVSAANVQGDAFIYDDGPRDVAWNAVWESHVRIGERGWSVEMRIPFSQIRYDTDDGEQLWGINFQRRRAADNELTSFAFTSRLVRGQVSAFGGLEGLRLSRSPRRAEIRPYLVTSARSAPADEGNPFFDGSEIGYQAGMDVRYGLGTSFTLDATVNPDFGQVEADPAVINLTALETFLPERRPFFVEDARVLDFRLTGPQNQLYYSRRIGRSPQLRNLAGADYTDVADGARILAAAKLTGRTPAGLSLGAMGAMTREERGRAFFREGGQVKEFTAEPATGYAVLRAQQEFRGGNSMLGGIATAVRRDLPASGELDILPSEAYTTGVDFEHAWADRGWALWGFAAASHVRGDSTALLRIKRSSRHYRQRPDLEWGSLDPAARSMSGFEWRMSLERRRGRWTGMAFLNQMTTGFEVGDLGFTTHDERLNGALRLNYREVDPGRWYRDYMISLYTVNSWSHELLNGDLDSWSHWRWAQTRNEFEASGNITFPNFWSLRPLFFFNPEMMSRQATRGGPRMVDPGSTGVTLNLATDNRARLSLRPSLGISRGLQGSGSSTEIGLGAAFQPTPQLEITLEPLYSRGSDATQYVTSTRAIPYGPTYGRRYLFADIERRTLSVETRVNWTFTPDLSFQLYAQPLLSSGDYVSYKQFSRPESFEFDILEEGDFELRDGRARCVGGRSCLAPDGVRWLDFDGMAPADFSFPDVDFNVRLLRATAVLRWEYRPGSTIHAAWQRRQGATARLGDFDLSRDLRALRSAPSDDVFLVKANIWMGL